MGGRDDHLKSSVPGLDPMKPVAGDIISARYRWSDENEEDPGKKIRPCLVIKAADDGSSMIIAPISTKQSWKAVDCVEIPPSQRGEAGLLDEQRSWIKLTEINKVDLPNLAVIPHAGPDGKMRWRRGRVSEELFKQVTQEMGIRISENTLKGRRIRADEGARIQLVGVRKVGALEEIGTAESRDEKIRRRAADLVAMTSSRSDPSTRSPNAGMER